VLFLEFLLLYVLCTASYVYNMYLSQLPLIASESCLSFTLCSTAYTVCTYPITLYWPQISSFLILQLSLLLIAFYTFLLFVAVLLSVLLHIFIFYISK
jgi:hypothetical protein